MRLGVIRDEVCAFTLVSITALCLLGTSVHAQKVSGSGEYSVKVSGSGSVDLGKAGAKPPVDAKGMDQVEERVKGMQEAIKAAVAQFQKANGTASEKVARLDGVLATIDNSLKEVGENGPLYQEIGKAIKASEDQQKKYKDKVTDPKVDAKIREKYQKLADKIGKNVNDLYERRIVLGKTCADLEKRKNALTQEKDFIVDLMTADDVAAANDALIQVIDSVKGVVKSIDDFAENITAEQPAKPTGKETR